MIGGRERSFGPGSAAAETRLKILAALEQEILGSFTYLPMLQTGSVTLLTRQASYAAGTYDPVMGFGGFACLRYEYSEAEWDAWAAARGGEISY